MRLIDADAFEVNMQNEWERNEISNGEWIHFREMINDEPTVDAVPARKGKWIYVDDDCDNLYDSYWCNNFHHGITVDAERRCDIGFVIEDLKFCPNCGASMTEGAEDEQSKMD